MMRSKQSVVNAAIVVCGVGALGVYLLSAAPFAHGSGAAVVNRESKPMVHSKPGKPGSGVTVTHKIDGSPQAGRAFSITLSFNGVSDPQGATVRVSSEGALQVSGDTSATLAAGSQASMKLGALANADGVYFLNVFTQQGTLSGASSIPIKVGAGQLSTEKHGQIKQAPGAERVISLPSK
jgi:hypothetical protein